MARIARIVAPSIPHHITQRGNRRQETFFNDDDYLEHLNLISTWCRKYKVDIWAYCLMPNHIHLVAVPGSEDALKAATDAFKGEDYSPPIKIKLTVKDFDPPDCFRIIYFAEISLCCG